MPTRIEEIREVNNNLDFEYPDLDDFKEDIGFLLKWIDRAKPLLELKFFALTCRQHHLSDVPCPGCRAKKLLEELSYEN